MCRLKGFATTLRNSLDREDIKPSLTAELIRYISAVPISKSTAATAAFEELDSCGTALWNAALKMKSQSSTPDNRNFLALGMEQLPGRLTTLVGDNSSVRLRILVVRLWPAERPRYPA